MKTNDPSIDSIKIKKSHDRKEKKWKMILSHHPPCSNFANHTLNIKNFQFCIGCFLGIPSTFLGFIMGNFLLRNPSFSVKSLFLLGIGFFLVQLFSFTTLTDYKFLKSLQKILIGIGAGFILNSTYNFLSTSFIAKIIIMIVIISIGKFPLHYLHYLKSKRVCNTCNKKWNKDLCPIDYCFADIPFKKNEILKEEEMKK